MRLKSEEYQLLYRKLEYRFKNSGDELVNKLKDEENLSKDELEKILKKLEYTFRKSGHEILDKIAKKAGLEDYSPIKYSNLKAHKLKKIREDSKNENVITKFEDFI